MVEKILIVDDDLDTLRLVGLMLQRQGYQISAANNGEQGLAKAVEEKPDLILLDVMMPDMDGYEVTRRLRLNPVTSSTPILMFTAKTQMDDKVVGFEMGADDYLTKPTHPSELQAHVRSLLARSIHKEEDLASGTPQADGYLVGVLAARGGLGVSSIASNLAAALFARTQADVILAELVPGQGTLGLDLGLGDGRLLNEILSGSPMEITREKVQSSLFAHPSGIKFLLASQNPRDLHLVSQGQNYQTLVTRLSILAPIVVLDLGTGLPPSSVRSLPICDEEWIVVEGASNSLRHARVLIDQMLELGVQPDRLSVILNNRVRSEDQMPAEQAQEELGYPIAATIAPAPELFLQAARMHTPAVLCQPNDPASEQFLHLADRVLERQQAR
ncbi:MAG: response regulator [Bacteroidota bacterium]